ncbi:MAG: MmgE/PrpD family protein [Deltaproteobacteria bacterium]|nr:MmgE/PrpD family protein [Deltaproteobacteria bacterium]
MKVTETLARYAVEASFSSFPKEVIHQGKRCFLDLLGVALGGSDQPLSGILMGLARDFGGQPQATVWGNGFKTSVLNAAFINGAMAHALDYDDTHIHSIVHPSAPVIPAVLAIAEWQKLSGRRALEAFIAGYEIETRIGLGMGNKLYVRGWHATSIFGRFGAAAAAGRLLQLSLDQMTQALGLAGTQAAGFRLVFGTMAKPFHPGKAAYDGVLSAILAGRGFTCVRDILEGNKGYITVFGEDSKAAPMVKGLGKTYEILKNTFKPYAACLLTHPTIDGLIRLKKQHKIEAEDVAEIRSEVARFCLEAAGQKEPKTALAGKFSIYYCAALALKEGVAGEDMFTDPRVLDPRMILLRKRVNVRVNPRLRDTEAKVTVIMKDGKKYDLFVNRPKGDPRNPLTDEELEYKFRTLASFALPKGKVNSLAKMIWNLDRVKDVRQMIRLCHS